MSNSQQLINEENQKMKMICRILMNVVERIFLPCSKYLSANLKIKYQSSDFIYFFDENLCH